MFKMIKKTKKIFAILILFLTLFGIARPCLAANQIISGEGNENFIARQYATRYKTTDSANSGENGIIARRLLMKNAGWNFSAGDRNISILCTESVYTSKHGETYEGNYYVPTNSDIRKAAKVAYCAWYQDMGTYGCDGNFADPSSLKRYAFAQQMVWECLGQSSATFVDSSVQNEYVTFRNETNNKIAKMGQRASFDGSTITIRQGEVTTATDTNDVLKDYESIDVTESGVHIRHNKGDNFMTFSVNDDCNIETLRISDSKFQEWGLIKSGTQDKRTTVYISFENDVQDQLFAMDYNDPVTLSLSLAIEAKGRLELIKTNDNRDLIDGSTFRVTGPNNYNERVTVTGGKIVIEDLIKGIYTITEESTKDSYLLNTETYTVEIKPNQTTTKTIVNKEPTRNYNCRKTKYEWR